MTNAARIRRDLLAALSLLQLDPGDSIVYRPLAPSYLVMTVVGTLGCLLASGPFTRTFAQDADAQMSVKSEIQLPRPDPEFKGKIGETYKDSTPELPAAGEGSEGQPERPAHPARRRRLRHVLHVRRPGADPAHGQAREQRAEVHPVPHHGALCSPTRAALLAGRNHHSCGTGVIIEMGTGYPGYTGIIPQSTALVSETLRDNGYATAMFGKVAQHAGAGDQPGRARSTAGPLGWGSSTSTASTRARPTSTTPSLYRDTPVPQPKSPEQGYHFTADMTDEAIAWTRPVSSNGTENWNKDRYAAGSSCLWGIRSGRSRPCRTDSVSAKSYRPSTLTWSSNSGESRSTSSGLTGLLEAGI